MGFENVFSHGSVMAALAVLAKLGIAVILAGLIGAEREIRGRPAGIRTHMLVVMGVTLICEVSKSFGGEQSRIAAQIVTGIGFLGAGAILRMGGEIRGLTTAASIWATAGIGMAVSVGGPFLLVAVIATLLALLTLTVVDNIERRIAPRVHAQPMVVTLEDRKSLVPLTEALEIAGGSVRSVRIEQTIPLMVTIDLVGERSKLTLAAVGHPGVISVSWQD